jgi:hypothetical protein
MDKDAQRRRRRAQQTAALVVLAAGAGRALDTPPVRWSRTANVAWTATLPGAGYSTPALAGDRLFVTAEPFWLSCVRKSDGQVLWQRTNDLNRVVGPDGLAEFRARCGEWFEAGIERLDRLIERERIARRLMDVPVDDPAEQRRLAALDGDVKRLDERIAALPEFRLESKPGGWRIGYTCCTPVSDGHGVFALFGNGVAVMYDLDGRLRWARFVRNRVKGYGQSMSPAWVGDTIGVHMDDEFYALDARTGRTRWVRYELQHEGSPAGMRVGGLDAFWACPVFEDDRMYLRTFAKLYCFRASEADKRRAAPPPAEDASGRKSDAEALDALGEL